jgi:peptidyl-prolyl cis-trans isomerase SurA
MSPLFFRLFSSIFFVTATSSYAAPVVIEKLEASVNNSLILKSDITRFRETAILRMQLDPIFAGTALAKSAKTASVTAIQDYLIQEKLILQAFPMTDSEVESEINSIQSGNKITREQLKTALAGQGFQFTDYFELIRVGAAKRNLLDREIRTKVSLSEDDLKNYYLTKYAKDKNVETSYHVLLISNENKKTIQQAAFALQKGEDFSEIAKKFSTDPSSASGGDLGVLNGAQMNSTLRTEIQKLSPGQVSPIVEVKNSSFLLIKLLNITTSNEAHFKRVEAELRAELSTTEFQKQLELWTARQKQVSFVHQAPESAPLTTKK